MGKPDLRLVEKFHHEFVNWQAYPTFGEEIGWDGGVYPFRIHVHRFDSVGSSERVDEGMLKASMNSLTSSTEVIREGLCAVGYSFLQS